MTEILPSFESDGLEPIHARTLSRLAGSPDQYLDLYRYCEGLRDIYANNPYALEEIDFADPVSVYSVGLNILWGAIEAKDADLSDQIQSRLDELYPLHAIMASRGTTTQTN